MIGLFHTILVPVDFSPCSDEAFKTAVQVARASESELFMLHVIDTGAIAAFNRLGLLAVPSVRQPSDGGCDIRLASNPGSY